MSDNAVPRDTSDKPFKYMPCKHCGESMMVGARTRKAPSHLECGIKATMENARQIREKKGPYYDRWLAGQKNYLENLGGGGAPSNGDG